MIQHLPIIEYFMTVFWLLFIEKMDIIICSCTKSQSIDSNFQVTHKLTLGKHKSHPYF